MNFLTMDTVVWAVIYGTMLWLTTTVIRAVVETWHPALKQPKPVVGVPHVLTRSQTWWNGVVLLIMPMALGAFFAWSFKSYPFPKGYDVGSSRIVVGVLCGGFAGQLYSLGKKLLALRVNTLMGGKTSNDGVLSNPPPSQDATELGHDEEYDVGSNDDLEPSSKQK
jgi:hypothetical protein